MALINCPECGKEISDKAPACIHCGCPLEQVTNTNLIPDIKPEITQIELFASAFMGNPSNYKRDLGAILQKISEQVNIIRKKEIGLSNDSIVKIENELSVVISNVIYSGERYATWSVIKAYFELVKFDTISDDTMKTITKPLVDKLNHIEYYNDGSSGNGTHILYWYPIHQVLKYASSDIKKPIEENLSHKNRKDHVEMMVNSHLKENSFVEIASKTYDNIPKCPTCHSTSIKKISTSSKATSVFFGGLLATGRVSKQWHCNNCGSEW